MAISLRSAPSSVRLLDRVTPRWAVFGVVAALYAALTIAVVHRAPFATLDQRVLNLDLMRRWPAIHPLVSDLVIVGQRGPSTLVALPWILYRSWRMRSWRPIVRLVVALFLLNLSVGAMKL